MRLVLAQPGFRRLFFAHCASLLGDSIMLVALSFAVLEATGSAAQLGLVLAAGSALLVASFLVSGVWADRLPRVRVMIGADVVRVVSQLTLAVLLATERAHLAALIALYGVSCIASAFFTPARSALIPQLLEPQLLMQGNGVLVTAQHSLSMLGFAGGGLLVAVAGSSGAIALDAVSFGISALLLAGIRPVATTEPRDRAPFLRELAEGWREVTARRWLWKIIALASLFLLLCEAPFQVIGPVVMRAHYAGALTWGLLGASLAAGSIMGSLLAPSKRLRRPMLVCLCLFFATAVVPVVLALHVSIWLLLPINAVVGVSHGMFDTLWHGTLQRSIPADRLARVSAWDWMGSLAFMPVGFALAGLAVGRLGTAPTLVAMSLAALLLAAAMLADRDIRALGAASPQSDRSHA
ncbi:MAG: hypothetical protein JWN41_737 [Thermoleophilia bacterium]|nr:hypothetical protein [Thermoleophilia bacterium]